MHLYHVPGTRSTRIAWLLEEVGEPYDITVMAREDRQTPEHLARHPLGRVPVVHDGEGYIFESAGLALHIADQHMDKGLIPAIGTHDRGMVYQWVLFAMTDMETPLVDIFIQKMFRDTPDQAIIDSASEKFRAAAKVVNAALEGKEYLVGGKFTVADLVIGGVEEFGRFMEVLDDANTNAHLDRMLARPAAVKAREIGA